MRMMVSVVSAEEARIAMLGGVDILDVKNPAEGSLGAQYPRVIREIKNLAGQSIEVSAAIGDMPNLPGTAALAAFGAAACGADYIKVGLRGPRSEAEALILLREVKEAVREFGISVIAGLYADYQRAGTLNPECLPRLAGSAGVQGCLVDTAAKDGLTLFDFLSTDDLSLMAERAHAAGLVFGLAGALQEKDLHAARDIGADVVGMRTAVCRDNRRDLTLDAARVQRLRLASSTLRTQ